jgi:triosephosphate isomerase
MRQPLVAGNWKLNGSRDSIESLVGGIREGVAGGTAAEVAICPPFVFIPETARMLSGTCVAWGAQTLAKEDSGAYTGEVSGAMLKDFGCTYVIVGHSERRALYGESNDVVAAKFAAARRAGLRPILCVGELLEQREAGETEAVIARQLDAVLDAEGVGALDGSVVAYEPVWAIGTGKTASPQQAQEIHAFIRARVAARDAALADSLRILYGGSVKGANAAELFAMDDIDGGLIGGAALVVDDFLSICRATD